jgi:hypothetical protein
LKDGEADEAQIALDKYCEENDRLQVRYLGHEKAKILLESGIISRRRLSRKKSHFFKRTE